MGWPFQKVGGNGPVNPLAGMAFWVLAVAMVGAGLPLPSVAQTGDLQVVDCLFPGQVRRLGASATTMTPRRQAKATALECRLGGGEYIEPAAKPAAPAAGGDALSLWLPLATTGVALAQVMVGEIHERTGDFAAAKAWYDKATAQGNARAQVNLASLYEQGRGVDRDFKRAQQLIVLAAGASIAAGLGDEKPRIELIDPQAALKRPRRSPSEVVAIDSPIGQVVVTGRAESIAGIQAVTVNGESKAVDANGLFSVPLALGTDPLKLQITAVDKMGASATEDYVLQRSAPATDASPPAGTGPAVMDAFGGKKLALVIANQAYQRWEALDTPLADGKAVSDTLGKHFGFEVTLLTNATRQATLAALNQLRANAGPDDQVIVYYAGHGQMDPVTSRGYWIPVDGERRDQSNWVSVIDVTDQLSAIQAKHVLVIADSCYSGTLAGSLASRVDTALSAEQRQRTLKQLTARRARVAFTSGGLEPVVDGGGGVHSLFAQSLLDVLTQVQAPIGALELSSAVSARFLATSKALKIAQRPAYAPIAFAGHEAGDFVLTPQQR